MSNELAIEADAKVRARAFFVGDGRLTNRRKQTRLLPEHSLEEERCKGEEAVPESMQFVAVLCRAKRNETVSIVCRISVGVRRAGGRDRGGKSNDRK